MASPAENRLLIVVVLIFGILSAVAGIRWLSSGSIVIREGGARVGVGGLPRPTPKASARVAGVIESDEILFYPLCLSWIALGSAMVILGAMAGITSNVLFFKLSAYSCALLLLLGFGTVAIALWSGP